MITIQANARWDCLKRKWLVCATTEITNYCGKRVYFAKYCDDDEIEEMKIFCKNNLYKDMSKFS